MTEDPFAGTYLGAFLALLYAGVFCITGDGALIAAGIVCLAAGVASAAVARGRR